MELKQKTSEVKKTNEVEMKEANASVSDNEYENSEPVSVSNRPPDVRDELTSEVAELTAKFDELTKRITSNLVGRGQKSNSPAQVVLCFVL